jgi:hypothetical protein
MTAPTFAEAVERINRARGFAELVSGLGCEPGDAYRRLVKIVHPDVVSAGLTRTATEAFARLSALWSERQGRTMARVGALVAAGDIANLYAVDDGLLKVPRRPGDNDLMAAEARALTRLGTDGDPRHRAYAPRLIESFTHEDPARARRTVNVLERLTGFVPLSALTRKIDPRDAAWMWRRLLVGLGWAHRAGVVHGAVLPAHVLIHPAEHGLALVDWCYSVAPGERIPALVTEFRSAYPPEVPGREAASPATDIFMATVLMRHLIDDPPAAMRRFADGCLYDAPRMRPQDAWHLLAELDELLDDLYGPRTFRPFTIH